MKQTIIDTHTHTRASDGTFTPEESVKYASEQGIKVMAKTDHDTVFGNDRAIAGGKKYGIKVIPGIEIDALHIDQETGTRVRGIELLGLGVDSEKLQPFCDKLSKIRFSNVDIAVDTYNQYIKSQDFAEQNSQKEFPMAQPAQISIDDVINYHNDNMNFENPKPFISKTTLMYFLIEKQAQESDKVTEVLAGNRATGSIFKSEYEFLFGKGLPKVNFYEAIDAVHEAGGKAVLAHPGRSEGYKNGMLPAWQPSIVDSKVDGFTPEQFVVDLKNHGLDGVEIYNYSGTDAKHGPQQDLINTYFAAIAEKLDLFTTFGSDCHGEKAKGPQLGKFGGTVDYSHLFES